MRWISLLPVFCLQLCWVPLVSADADRWYMNEEWYDWHSRSSFEADEPRQVQVEIHFVGPGAVTPRGLYIRGNANAGLDRIRVSGIKDHQDQPWHAAPERIEAVGTPTGKQWWRLATGANRRGFEPLVLTLPEGVDFDFALISPNERYVTHGRAERWIRDHQHGKEVRCGMPMGGIGAGKVEIARDGWLRNITTNNNIDAPFYHPELCFLAASINGHGRILRDESFLGLRAVDHIKFQARYPVANLGFEDEHWPMDIQLSAWSPIIPHDVENSALPVAIFEFKLDNPTQRPVEAKLAVAWQNLIGATGRPQPMGRWGRTGHYMRIYEPDGNQQRFTSEDELEGILFTGPDKTEPDAEGHYFLGVRAEDGLQIGETGAFTADSGTSAWRDFAGESPTAEAPAPIVTMPGTAAALTVSCRLGPGEERTVPIVLTWYMDHFHQMGREDMGHYYHNEFADAREVAIYVLDHRRELFENSVKLQQIFDQTDVPAWFSHMLLNDLYVLSTDTWLTRDGRFSVNEGATNMYGVMGTMDQKLYASHHLALLFPQLQKQELRQFAELQNDNGGITHDLGAGQFVSENKAFDWPDLCSAFSILSCQVYRYTGDKEFWQQIRPHVLKAVEALATTWDPDNVGVPGNGSTFDDEDSYRVFSYTTGLWLCVLRLAEQIAEEQGDQTLVAECQQRFQRAKKLAMDELWTGSYFRYGSSPSENKRTDASHFSPLAGEFWTRLLGFEGLYDPPVRDKALATLFRLHWNENFKLPPKIVNPDGTLFPRDSEHRNAPVSWPMHSRAMMSGSAFFFGMEQQGWDLLKTMRDNIIAANGPDPWDQSLYWNPVTAEIDWGIFYMTAPASWLAYQALIDTHLDVVTGTLTIRPAAMAEVHEGSFPVILTKGWYEAEVSDNGSRIRLQCVRDGEAGALRAIVVPPGFGDVEIRLNGDVMPYERTGDRLELASHAVYPMLKIWLIELESKDGL